LAAPVVRLGVGWTDEALVDPEQVGVSPVDGGRREGGEEQGVGRAAGNRQGEGAARGDGFTRGLLDDPREPLL
jgi:hypothetical protein